MESTEWDRPHPLARRADSTASSVSRTSTRRVDVPAEGHPLSLHCPEPKNVGTYTFMDPIAISGCSSEHVAHRFETSSLNPYLSSSEAAVYFPALLFFSHLVSLQQTVMRQELREKRSVSTCSLFELNRAPGDLNRELFTLRFGIGKK